MFEDNKTPQSQEPKDIFQELEPTPATPPQPLGTVPAPTITQPVSPAPITPGGVNAGMAGGPKEPLADLSQITRVRPGRFWKIFIFIFIIALLVIAGWYVYGKFFRPAAQIENLPITNQSETPGTLEPTVLPPDGLIPDDSLLPGITESSTDDLLAPAVEIDTDRDGLPDNQEQSLGTNPLNPDTDGDELSDRDEVVVYRANPLNPDTDGDGYQDGNEVRNNYDPLGPGRLRSLQEALEPTSTLPIPPVQP